MAFRRSVPQQDLEASVPAEQIAQHETVYRASLGGYYPPEEQPVPGTPLEGDRQS